MGKFVLRRMPGGVRFDLRAANGQTVATSESYAAPAAALAGIRSVRRCVGTAPLEDLTAPAGEKIPNPKFQLFQDRAGQFRFRLKARNGKIIAVSEGYRTRAAALNGIDSVRASAQDAEVEWSD